MKTNKIIGCLLCGGPAELRHNEYPGYQEPETFKIYHCWCCNTAFSLPRVETSTIYEMIYKNGDSVPGYDRYWKYAQIVKNIADPLKYLAKAEDIYWGMREALALCVKDKGSTKIVEIGSGLGYLTYSLLNAGYDVIGLDLSQAAVTQAIINYGNHYLCADAIEYSRRNAESYDIVILTEVIEHIDKPLDFMQSIIKLLKPNGRAIITTPNKSFYPLDIIWATDNPPVHCWWFSETSIIHMSKQLNATVSFLDFSSFHNIRYARFDIKKLRHNPIRMPVFDKYGHVRRPDTQKRSAFYWGALRRLLSRIPLVHGIGKRFISLTNPDIVFCKQRGDTMCAVLNKNDALGSSRNAQIGDDLARDKNIMSNSR